MFEAANLEVRARWRHYLDGIGTTDLMLASSLRALEAERELSKKTDRQLAALDHHLRRMRNVERINKDRFEAGRIPLHDFAQARFYRAQAELWLEQAQSN